MNKEYFKFVERELFDYENNIKAIRALEDDLINASGQSDINGSIRSGVSKSTENKAMKLINNKTLMRMTKTINDIDKGVNKLDGELLELYILIYKKQIHKYKIISTHMIMNEVTYWRKKRKIVSIIAKEMGLI